MKDNIFRQITERRFQILWTVIAFQGGFMNAGGYLACHRFVSHMTGYGSYVGVAIGRKHYLGAFEMALGPVFFLGGAVYAGWLVDRRLVLEQEPKLKTGFVSLALLNLIIYLGEFTEYLGEFGEPLELQRDFLLLFLLCFACGLQNGLFVGLTTGQIRTTHLTGYMTDIGINLPKLLTLPREDPTRQQLAGLIGVRVKIVLAFSAGSMIATLVFRRATYEGFAVPCLISFFLVWYVRTLLKDARRGEPTDGSRSHKVADRPSPQPQGAPG